MTYSRRKRQREQNGKAPVFRNRTFGAKLLNQIFQIIAEMDEALGYEHRIIPALVDYLRKETGLLRLNSSHDLTAELYNFFIAEQALYNEEIFDLRLDTVELACKYASSTALQIDRGNIRSYQAQVSYKILPLVDAMNARMMEDSFGFQYERGQIIEFSSQFAYEEVIVPMLGLISDQAYAAADAEFRDALEEFKQGNYDDCIADCGNAFESTLKVIARLKSWDEVSENDTANKLLDVAYRRELIPTYMQSQFNGLRSMISGASTVRNKEGGHGAGTVARIVDKHLAAYQLQQTAGAITFLIACAR